MWKNFRIIQLFVVSIVCFTPLNGQNLAIEPGKVWRDTQGNPINAHGGGLLYYQGTYYWFGEIKKDSTWRVPYITSWECYRTHTGGVSCYSSKNLIDWKYEGVALASNTTDTASDIHYSKVIERPKIIYNKKTKKFVMWLHIDSENYNYARAGVAISDYPAGPYTYLRSFRPNNQMCRDMTLFKDDDGKAYHIFSSENNSTMHISLLTDDYLNPSGTYIRILEKKWREAPALFKHKGKYYLITSACSGWLPNAASVAVADSMLGTWKIKDNPCIGPQAETTFNSQSTYVLSLEGKENAFIFMADRWNKKNLLESKYIWLPVEIKDDKFTISWKDSWNLGYFK